MLSFVSVIVYMVHFMRKGPKKGKGQQTYSVKELGLQVGLMFIWTLVLNKVCSFKYGEKISWFLVFLPVLFMIIIMILAFKLVDELDLSKGDIHQLLDKMNKREEDDLEGFQGCGD